MLKVRDPLFNGCSRASKETGIRKTKKPLLGDVVDDTPGTHLEKLLNMAIGCWIESEVKEQQDIITKFRDNLDGSLVTDLPFWEGHAILVAEATLRDGTPLIALAHTTAKETIIDRVEANQENSRRFHLQFSNMLPTNAPPGTPLCTLENAAQFARADALAWCVQKSRELVDCIEMVLVEIRHLPAL